MKFDELLINEAIDTNLTTTGKINIDGCRGWLELFNAFWSIESDFCNACYEEALGRINSDLSENSTLCGIIVGRA